MNGSIMFCSGTAKTAGLRQKRNICLLEHNAFRFIQSKIRSVHELANPTVDPDVETDWILVFIQISFKCISIMFCCFIMQYDDVVYSQSVNKFYGCSSTIAAQQNGSDQLRNELVVKLL